MPIKPESGPQFLVSAGVDVNFDSPVPESNPQCALYLDAPCFTQNDIEVRYFVNGQRHEIRGFQHARLPRPIRQHQAPFTLAVKDLSGSGRTITQWNLIFAPSGGTGAASPLSQTTGSFSGVAVAQNGTAGEYALIPQSAGQRIVNPGSWKWSLRFVMQDGSGAVKQFCIDPQMSVEN